MLRLDRGLMGDEGSFEPKGYAVVFMNCKGNTLRQFMNNSYHICLTMDTDKRFLVTELETSHVLKNNKNKTYRGRCNLFSVPFVSFYERAHG